MTIETLAFGYGLVEGPRCDGEDNLYFSDVRDGGVYRRAPGGEITTVVPKRRGVGGIALHADGGLVISGKSVAHVRAGETRVLFQRPDIPGFNDLFCDALGRVYTGSMRSDPFSTTGPRTLGECYRIDGEGRATELYGNVSLTNGIGFSPDGRRLYHADSVPRQIIVHDIDRGGSVTNRQVFAQLARGLAPDGLAVDEDGGVWVAVVDGGCVQRFTPQGALDVRVDVPAKFVTSLCFGGADRKDLYVVTADNTDDAARRGTIFRTRSPHAGTPVHPARI
jgi:gluconolactonase